MVRQYFNRREELRNFGKVADGAKMMIDGAVNAAGRASIGAGKALHNAGDKIKQGHVGHKVDQFGWKQSTEGLKKQGLYAAPGEELRKRTKGGNFVGAVQGHMGDAISTAAKPFGYNGIQGHGKAPAKALGGAFTFYGDALKRMGLKGARADGLVDKVNAGANGLVNKANAGVKSMEKHFRGFSDNPYN